MQPSHRMKQMGYIGIEDVDFSTFLPGFYTCSYGAEGDTGTYILYYDGQGWFLYVDYTRYSKGTQCIVPDCIIPEDRDNDHLQNLFNRYPPIPSKNPVDPRDG